MTAFNSQARRSEEVLGSADSAGGETYYKRVNVTPQQDASQQALQLHHSWQLPDMHIILWDIFIPWKHFCLPPWRELPGGRMFSPVVLLHWCQNYCQIFPRDLPVIPSVPDWLRISALQYTPQEESLSELPSRTWGSCGYSLTWKETFLVFFWVLAVCKPGILRTADVIFSEEPFRKDSSSAKV